MTSGLRVLHCGGFLFDSPFWEGPSEWVDQRNQDLWITFEKVLSLCRSENTDLLLLTGNLFEQEYVKKKTVERLAKSFSELENTKVLIIPAEKDPLVISSAYRLAVWPTNVHIFPGGISSVKIASLNTTVYGAGWTAYRQDINFLDDFRVVDDDTLQLMLLHSKQVDPEQIASTGLNYLALAGEEIWSGIQLAGKTYWADSGSPEARSFSRPGPRGVLLGEIAEDSAEFEFYELGQRKYIEKQYVHRADLGGLVQSLLSETTKDEQIKDLFRIILTGPTKLTEEAVPKLQKLLKNKIRFFEILAYEEKISGFSLDEADEDFPTFTKIYYDKMQEYLNKAGNPDDYEHWALVQKIGLAALEQGRVDNEN